VLFASGVSASVFTRPGLYVSLGICALALVLAFKKKHPILIICLSAVLGIAAGYLIPGIV